jgi:hypothetical protein
VENTSSIEKYAFDYHPDLQENSVELFIYLRTDFYSKKQYENLKSAPDISRFSVRRKIKKSGVHLPPYLLFFSVELFIFSSNTFIFQEVFLK